MTTVRFEKLDGIKLKMVMVNHQIDLHAGAFALQRLDNGRKANSIKADQSAILHLYRFCERHAICLLERMTQLDPFKVGEIEAFSSDCGYTATGGQISPGGYAARMRGAQAFIDFLWRFYLDHQQKNVTILEEARLRYSSMSAGFKMYTKVPFKIGHEDRVGLSEELQTRFFLIINPAAENTLNPWKSHKIRWRNFILLLLLVLGGNRKGETLLLKLNHFQLTGPRKYYDILKIAANDYPRMETPSVKTLGRQVELHEDFAALIEYYITHVRPQFVGWKRTAYLLISSRDGLPLSLQTPNAVLNELIQKHPDFKGRLSPHRLRNTFHDLLNVALDQKFKHYSPLNRALLKSPIQEAAGGWVRNSLMPERYAKGSIQAKAKAAQVFVQAQVLRT